ncbi:hypothetical protein NDU88_006165 [Pleurodeles waltl]|uniref:Uncharacterized protein n=1 Tax=Pleurodeles waltl TaxID=8319 RepID=A0AAV7RKT9_PLEWA|nr:hypothetical protein NDU88_006165 [Pleurodeles waltl]
MRWSELCRLGPGFAARPRSGGHVRPRQDAWSCRASGARALRAPAADQRCERGRVFWARTRGRWRPRPALDGGPGVWRLAGRQRGYSGALGGDLAGGPCARVERRLGLPAGPCGWRLRRGRRKGGDPLEQLCSAVARTQWVLEAGWRCGRPVVAFIWRRIELSLGVALRSVLQRRG